MATITKVKIGLADLVDGTSVTSETQTRGTNPSYTATAIGGNNLPYNTGSVTTIKTKIDANTTNIATNTTKLSNIYNASYNSIDMSASLSADVTSKALVDITNTASANTVWAVKGKITASTSGASAAVYGHFDQTTSSSPGAGVTGYVNADNGGNPIGVYGTSSSSTVGSGVAGIGFYGVRGYKRGTGYGLYTTDSANIGGITYPFTGAHIGFIASTETCIPGDIVCDTGTVARNLDLSNVNTYITKSSAPNQKAAVGVYVEDREILEPVDYVPDPTANMPSPPPEDTVFEIAGYKSIGFNAIGEGKINVVGEGGDIQVGDLIVTSSTAGKGMKQADGVVYNYTVAKARENVTFASASEEKQIACIYMAG